MRYRHYSIRTPNNKEEKDSWTRDREIPAVELRGYMALCRFAEAHARACHRNYCTLDDADAAINIVNVSKMSAGVNTNSLLGGDQRDSDPEFSDLEIKINEADQIRRIRQTKDNRGTHFLRHVRAYFMGSMHSSKMPRSWCDLR